MKRVFDSRESQTVHLTLYGQGFGAVEEYRKVSLEGIEQELVLQDVPRRIEQDSLVLEGVKVLGYTFAFDPITGQGLLDRYLGMDVYRKLEGVREKRAYRLHAVESDGWVLVEDLETGEVSFAPGRELLLPKIPEGWSREPMMICRLVPEAAERIRMHYLTKGVRWHAHYTVRLSGEDLELTGWAQIENRSGKDFKSVHLRLVAGDVRRVREEEDPAGQERIYAASLAASEASPGLEAYGDYYAYAHPEPVTLVEGREEQVRFLHKRSVAYRKHYELNLYSGEAEVILTLVNDGRSGLGEPLPAGRVKVYDDLEDSDVLAFIGEDAIDHTPVEEEIRLSIGRAFDVHFDHKLMERKKSGGFEYYQYACEIRNHKRQGAEVHVAPQIWETWEMVQSSHDYETISSREIRYVVQVPAGQTVTVRYLYKVDRRVELTVKGRE